MENILEIMRGRTMKLVELLSMTLSNHFALRVVGEANEKRYKRIDYRGHEYDDYEVLNISCTCEVEQPSPITHSVSVTPILLITIRR